MAPATETKSPPILYKYCPPERIDILENLQMKFSAPTSFNDAFDSHHLLTKDSRLGKIKRIRFRNHQGVFCMSETSDNHLMWVNYAKQHTGFVIGFDASSSFFGEDGRKLDKVVYQSRPPTFDSEDVRGCFCKSPDWSYEREWRCVRTFDNSESRFVLFGWDLVKEIIFGNAVEDKTISRIAMYAASFDANPAFYFSRRDNDGWRFFNEPKHITMCPHCNGSGYEAPDIAKDA